MDGMVRLVVVLVGVGGLEVFWGFFWGCEVAGGGVVVKFCVLWGRNGKVLFFWSWEIWVFYIIV